VGSPECQLLNQMTANCLWKIGDAFKDTFRVSDHADGTHSLLLPRTPFLARRVPDDACKLEACCCAAYVMGPWELISSANPGASGGHCDDLT
jgi:hypothetical protein